MRSVPEWRGITDDADVPLRVQLRIWETQNGMCAACGRDIRHAPRALDHAIALCNGGQHRESNLRWICEYPCHKTKTAADVSQKARSYRIRLSNAGLKRTTSRPIPGSRASGIRKRMSGKVERWPTEE